MEKRFVGVKEIAEYLGVSIHTIYYWTCLKKIPYVKMGKLLKFDLREIEGWIKERRIQPID